jgi:hypothetical protein
MAGRTMAPARHHGHGNDRARSILEMASKFRGEYSAQLLRTRSKESSSTTNKGEPQAYLIPAGQARDEAVAKLIGSLIDQGVEVFRLDRELHVVLQAQILRRTNPVAEKARIVQKIGV